MKRVKFFVIRVRNGQEAERYEVGNAMQDEHGCISARRYDEFKRLLFKIKTAHINKTQSTKDNFYLTNENNERDTFGGYPAYGFLNTVKFAH